MRSSPQDGDKNCNGASGQANDYEMNNSAG